VLTTAKTNLPLIVFVDDDDREAEPIARSLEAAGFGNRVIHFRDGQDALDYFIGRDGVPSRREKGSRYFVLLDIHLAGADGMEILRRFKTHPELRTIPVFMLTSTDDPGIVEQCHRLGCNGYIQKPADFAQFAETVHHLGFLLSVMLLPPGPEGESARRLG
jgi:CheY-like chemotaxis protein